LQKQLEGKTRVATYLGLAAAATELLPRFRKNHAGGVQVEIMVIDAAGCIPVGTIEAEAGTTIESGIHIGNGGEFSLRQSQA
jgi:hypothetical protein